MNNLRSLQRHARNNESHFYGIPIKEKCNIKTTIGAVGFICPLHLRNDCSNGCVFIDKNLFFIFIFRWLLCVDIYIIKLSMFIIYYKNIQQKCMKLYFVFFFFCKKKSEVILRNKNLPTVRSLLAFDCIQPDLIYNCTNNSRCSRIQKENGRIWIFRNVSLVSRL